ncbi:hypothetical protein [Streptomyces sp. NPDC058683]|uniref:hypothetical protein n=1 Tax=Streptomyces sp. NPDC058683 TaxID=3346597 RepID=UPI003654F9A7
MTAPAQDTSTMSAECAPAQRRGYSAWHEKCSQTQDIPLPHSLGILLIRRCTCPHHHCTPAG